MFAAAVFAVLAAFSFAAGAIASSLLWLWLMTAGDISRTRRDDQAQAGASLERPSARA